MLQALVSGRVCVPLSYNSFVFGTKMHLVALVSYSLVGQDSALSPRRPGFESRWENFFLPPPSLAVILPPSPVYPFPLFLLSFRPPLTPPPSPFFGSNLAPLPYSIYPFRLFLPSFCPLVTYPFFAPLPPSPPSAEKRGLPGN